MFKPKKEICYRVTKLGVIPKLYWHIKDQSMYRLCWGWASEKICRADAQKSQSQVQGKSRGWGLHGFQKHGTSLRKSEFFFFFCMAWFQFGLLIDLYPILTCLFIFPLWTICWTFQYESGMPALTNSRSSGLKKCRLVVSGEHVKCYLYPEIICEHVHVLMEQHYLDDYDHWWYIYCIVLFGALLLCSVSYLNL